MSQTASSHRLHPAMSQGSRGQDVAAPAEPPEAVTEPIDSPTVISQRPKPGAAPTPRTVALQDLGRALAGERLGQFELIEYVGGGGMGAVFRARDTMLDRQVALKVLSREQGADEEMRRRFLNEARSSARLDHENIARVYHIGEDRGLNYIVFEFVEGTTLRDLVDTRGPLPPGEAISYTLQVAEALSHASARDVVHRDVKPSNMIVSTEGRVKLVDMGLARLQQRDRDIEDITASGVTLGTFDYISPEQARDPRVADVRSDIYSLGCTLFYMLTSRPPFAEGNMLQKLLHHNSEEPPDPREFNTDLPAEISDVVRKMLAKDPRRRYQTANDLIVDLLVQADRIGLAAADLHTTLLVTQAGCRMSIVERHLPWMAPVALLLGAVLVLDYVGRNSESVDTFISDIRAPARRGAEAVSRQARPSMIKPSAAQPNAGERASSNGDASVVAAPVEQVSPRNAQPANETTLRLGESPSEALAIDAETIDSDVPPLASGTLVVSPTMTGPGYYSTLRTALAAARRGDVVELWYDGPREERSLSLMNQDLTVRAGPGFNPTIQFHPSETDPLAYSRAMLAISGGSLTLEGAHIDFRTPSPFESGAEAWSVFELEQSEVDLSDCSLTVRTAADDLFAYQPDVSFFRVRSELSSDMMMGSTEEPVEPVVVRLRNVIVRGDATLVDGAAAQPIDLAWENGLLALARPMLLLAGGQTPVASATSRVRVDLRRVTIEVGEALVRQASRFDAPHLLDLELSLNQCVVSAESEVPLIIQTGMGSIGELREHLRFSGRRTAYRGFRWDDFWSIADLRNAELDTHLSFDDWRAYWSEDFESQPSWNRAQWASARARDRLPEDRTTDEYLLDLGSAGDLIGVSGTPPGMDITRLPTLRDESFGAAASN